MVIHSLITPRKQAWQLHDLLSDELMHPELKPLNQFPFLHPIKVLPLANWEIFFPSVPFIKFTGLVYALKKQKQAIWRVSYESDLLNSWEM